VFFLASDSCVGSDGSESGSDDNESASDGYEPASAGCESDLAGASMAPSCRGASITGPPRPALVPEASYRRSTGRTPSASRGAGVQGSARPPGPAKALPSRSEPEGEQAP